MAFKAPIDKPAGDNRPDDTYLDQYDPADELCLRLVSPSRSTREEDTYEGGMERYYAMPRES